MLGLLHRSGRQPSEPPNRLAHVASDFVPRRSFARIIDELEADGRASVGLDELAEIAEAPRSHVAKAVVAMRRSGRLRSPARGFYVIVPVAYRSRGDVPADWYLDDWMAHLGRRYRVSGLTAAARHGARHQAAQSFDVVLDRAMARSAAAWPPRLRLFTDRTAHPTTRIEGPYAPLQLATAETCAFDLATWTKRFAGPSHIATLLAELTLDPKLLGIQAPERPVSVVRRLGYLLERAQPKLPLTPLHERSSAYGTPTLLAASGERRGGRDRRWNVLVNASVELDVL